MFARCSGLTVTDARGRPKWTYGGDFGEHSHDSNFCINGLLWPDRGLDLRSLYYDRFLPYIGIGDGNTYAKYGPANVMPVLTECVPQRMLGLQCAQNFFKLDTRRASSLDICSSSSQGDGLNMLPVKAGGRKHSRVSFSLEANHNPVLRAVQTMVAKPTLLEAKQCMKTFHCVVRSVTHEGGDENSDYDGFASTGYNSTQETPLLTPVHTPAPTPKAAMGTLQRKFSAAKLSRSQSKRAVRKAKTTGIHYLPNLDEGPRGGVPVQVAPPARRRGSSLEVKDYFFDSPMMKEDLGGSGPDFTYISDSGSEEEDDEEDFSTLFDDGVGRLILNVNLAVENRFDHVEDVFSKLEFEAFLLCDGLIVAVEKVAPFLFLKPNAGKNVDHSSKYVSFSKGTCKQKGDVEFDLCWLNARPDATQSQELFCTKNFCGAGQPTFLQTTTKDKYIYTARVPVIPGLPWSATMLTSTTDVEGMRTELRGLRDQCREYIYTDPEAADLGSPPSPTLVNPPLWTRLRSTETPEMTLDTLQYAYPFSTTANREALTKPKALSNTWSVVILARNAGPTAWAEEGYPLGCQEIDITAQCAAVLDPALRPRLSRPPSGYPTPQQTQEAIELDRSEYISVGCADSGAAVASLLGSSSSSSDIFPHSGNTVAWNERENVELRSGSFLQTILFLPTSIKTIFTFICDRRHRRGDQWVHRNGYLSPQE